MFVGKPALSVIVCRGLCGLLLFASVVAGLPAWGQGGFEVATIRPSSGDVKFERNGQTEVAYGTLRMRDVTVATCIHWAYGTPLALIEGSPSLKATHYDIVAKTDAGASDQQMRMMMRVLLEERFKLKVHVEQKELRVYSLVVSKAGVKMHPSAPGGKTFRENSATGMVARSLSMPELADYLSDPLQAPLTDLTGLGGRYDLVLDFTPYVDQQQCDLHADVASVLGAALKGELGLELVRGRQQVNVTVVDSFEPPSEN